MKKLKDHNELITYTKRNEQYPDAMSKLTPSLHHTENSESDSGKPEILSKTVTFQVTDACNLCCSYCYQINKGTRRMSFETAKTFIDKLLAGDYDNYISVKDSPGIVIEFIGGEPFLEIDLIDQIVSYWIQETMRLRHQWAVYYAISICSNGVLYKDERVQRFLNKHKNHISFSVTLDGDKSLHDSCRVFYDGSGSYDLAYEACEDWMSKGYYMGSKITIAPENLKYLFDALKHMISIGYKDIHANCVYEAKWNTDQALLLYNEMKNITNYIFDNNLKDIYVSLFDHNFFRPLEKNDITNWCGGTGNMLSVDPDGYLFPCIRYMESSLGNDIERYSIGHVDEGIGVQEKDQERIHCLNCINRKTESTEECFYCPIASGCSWCSAYNYQINGTPDSRVINICIMHKARALANAYYWNKIFVEQGYDAFFEIYVKDEWALEIISEDELNMLKDLRDRAKNRPGVVQINAEKGDQYETRT